MTGMTEQVGQKDMISLESVGSDMGSAESGKVGSAVTKMAGKPSYVTASAQLHVDDYGGHLGIGGDVRAFGTEFSPGVVLRHKNKMCYGFTTNYNLRLFDVT